MKLNYYQFKTNEAKAVKALVKGLLTLAGESAVKLCVGTVHGSMIYVTLVSPIPLSTVKAVAVAMHGAGMPGADMIAGSLEFRKTVERADVQAVPIRQASAALPESGHPRFDPNQAFQN